MYSKFLQQLTLTTLFSFLLITQMAYAQSCENDEQAPVAICSSEVLLNLGDNSTSILYPEAIDEGSYDDCTTDNLDFRLSLDMDSNTVPSTTSLELSQGFYVVIMWVGDEAGNWTRCFSEVEVTGNNSGCGNDMTSPTPYCLAGLQVVVSPSQPVLVFGQDFDAGSFDDCTSPSALDFRLELGSASATPPETSFFEFTTEFVGNQEVTVWVIDEAGNYDYCSTYIEISSGGGNIITGKVYIETNGDCELNEEENGLGLQQVEAIGNVTGEVYHAFSDSQGEYFFITPEDTEDTAYEIKLVSSLNYGGNCPTSYVFTLPFEEGANLNIPVQFEEDCIQLHVDIGAPRLERCVDNPYFVYACNYGSQTADNASVIVTLDDDLDLKGASIEYFDLGDNIYKFIIGTLEPGACTGFVFDAFLSCDALLGQAHEVKATIKPESNCEEVNPLWSGASIQVKGECDGDQVNMEIKNVGDGDMSEELNFVIVEDVILLRNGAFKLDAEEAINIVLPADGTTWRLEAAQEAFHPGFSMPALTIEGCGGINELGAATMFPQDERDFDVSIDYQQNTAALIPNEMTSSPTGYGEAHYIYPNVDLEYLVNFDNTSKSAGKAVIEVELSSALEMASIRPGISNLAYEFEREENKARFVFNDLSTLEAGELGFIKFSAVQKADNPSGTIIENQALITLDENTPIRTSIAFHTVGNDFVEVVSSNEDFAVAGAELEVFPNPATNYLTLKVSGYELNQAHLNLFNPEGQLVRIFNFTQNQITIEHLNLPTGIYFYQVEEQGKSIQYGKLSVK